MIKRESLKFAEILQDPSAVYDRPEEILEDKELTEEQKLELLLQWKYDAILIDECDDENMCGTENSKLDQVLKCLNHLNSYEDILHS